MKKIIKWLHSLDEKTKSKPIHIDEIFADFVGNQEAVNLIKLQIKSYLKKGKSFNLAFFGSKSTGKTSLANKIKTAVGLPMLHLTKGMVASEKAFLAAFQQFLWKNNTETIPLVVFIDEAHSLSKKLQDGLLTALEKNDHTLHIQELKINVSNVIWIIATTNPEKLGSAFKSRFLEIYLNSYSNEEIKEIIIINNKQSKNPIEFSNEELELISNASRFTPRKAITFLNLWSEVKQINPDLSIKEFLKNYLGIDKFGLSKFDRKYILFLSERKTASLQQISSSLDLDKDFIQNTIEPFLLRKQVISISSKGRSLNG